VKQVIDTVSRVVGAPVKWTAAPRRPGDPAALYAASERLQRELGWRPKYADLEQIVRHAWQWHRAHPHGYGSSLDRRSVRRSLGEGGGVGEGSQST
jgi:UDP-glucose 4-epimerase